MGSGEDKNLFRSCWERVRFEFHYVTGLILRYIRANYARVLNNHGQCSMAQTSIREVLDSAGICQDEIGMDFLDHVGFPNMDILE